MGFSPQRSPAPAPALRPLTSVNIFLSVTLHPCPRLPPRWRLPEPNSLVLESSQIHRISNVSSPALDCCFLSSALSHPLHVEGPLSARGRWGQNEHRGARSLSVSLRLLAFWCIGFSSSRSAGFFVPFLPSFLPSANACCSFRPHKAQGHGRGQCIIFHSLAMRRLDLSVQGSLSASQKGQGAVQL